MVIKDPVNGFSISISEPDSIEVDLSTLFTDTGSTYPDTETLYVWLESVYQVDQVTTAKYIVSDSAPLTDDRVVSFAQLNLF